MGAAAGTMHVAVTAIGADRPGIVAAVTGVLAGHDANIEDSSMTILRGRFAMVLVVAVPEGHDLPALESEMRAATAELDLLVHLEPLGATGGDLHGEPWALSVYGADRPGIVHRVTSVLGSAGVNITDLTTRVVGDEQRPVYVMLLSLTVPAGTDIAALGDALAAAARDLGIECNLHPAEPDIL